MPQRFKIKGWLSAKEAQQILGVTYSALRNHVNAKRIRSMTPPGASQMRYSEGDVYRLKRDIDAAVAVQDSPSTEFVRATVSDIPAAVALADAVFGGINTIPVEKRVAWLQKNPDIDYLLKLEGQIVGYLSLIPLAPETIEDLLTKRKLAKDVTVDEILTYAPGVPVDLYGMAIGVKPGVSRAQKREWGASLLRGTQDLITRLGTQGIIIRTIRAHSTTPDGIRLMRHFGFTETEAVIPNMRDFSINIAVSGIPIIMRYKKALEEWQRENSKAAPEARSGRKAR